MYLSVYTCLSLSLSIRVSLQKRPGRRRPRVTDASSRRALSLTCLRRPGASLSRAATHTPPPAHGIASAALIIAEKAGTAAGFGDLTVALAAPLVLLTCSSTRSTVWLGSSTA